MNNKIKFDKITLSNNLKISNNKLLIKNTTLLVFIIYIIYKLSFIKVL